MVAALGCSDDSKKSTATASSSASPTELANPKGVTPINPLVGNEGNLKPLSPKDVKSWTQLYKWAQQKGNGWYWAALEQRIGVSKSDVRKYIALGKKYDLRFILVLNSTVSDAQARAKLREQGFKDIGKLPIVRYGGIENTWLQSPGVWHAFWDIRSQVRVSLGTPLDFDDLTKGFDVTRGVLAMCCNPWDLKKVPGPVPPSPTPTSTPTGTPTGTPTSTPTSTPLQPKDPSAFPAESSPSAPASPTPIATLSPSPAPHSPDPTPTDLPIHTPEPVPSTTPTAGPGNPSPNPTPSDAPTESPAPAPSPTHTTLPPLP